MAETPAPDHASRPATPWPPTVDTITEAHVRYLARALTIAFMVPDKGIVWDPRLLAIIAAEGQEGLVRITRDDRALFCTGIAAILENCYG